MKTVAEILEAAKQLSPDEIHQLVETLRAELHPKQPLSGDTKSPLGLPADFTERLTEAFNQARLKTIRESQ
jgi:hypothetical protein